jgi:hypothetical protein
MSLGGLLSEVGRKRTLGDQGRSASAGGDCVGGVLRLLHDVVCVVLLGCVGDGVAACG